MIVSVERGVPATAAEATGAVVGGQPTSIPTLPEAARALAAALRPRAAVAREASALRGELARVVVGGSTINPAQDRRFLDPAWSQNPVFRRIAQAYLAGSGAVDRLVDDYTATVDDVRSAERARFAADIALTGTAPTNFLPTNPAGLKRAFDTGGASVLRGARNAVTDILSNGGLPSTVDPNGLRVGTDLACSPGSVVHRDDMAEVLQYRPSTESVHTRPLLVVPPPIGRFYFLDLRPSRSFVEYVAAQGHQVFVLSWRNPGPRQGDWGLDDYAARVLSAVDVAREVTGSPDVNLMGFCAGGIISTTLLNHLAATGDDRVASMSYGVTLLDFAERAPLAAFRDRRLLAAVRRRAGRTGVITARQLGSAFTWMRPQDLVFSYVVNNWVLGEPPPVFDILAWNADGTNLPETLYRQFIDLFERNALTRPGEVSVLGSAVDLLQVKVPTFVTGAIADHLTPWRGCYRTTQLLGGDSTFVLSHSGHIASLVNPPGNPRAHHWVGGAPGPDPQAWFDDAERRSGSWWEAWTAWAAPHAGDRVSARAAAGSAAHPALGPAPGRYARSRPAS